MTREHYLKTLGLGGNSTWEEVHSAYARLLEHHLADGIDTDEDSSRLKEVEEAFSFLIQDSVIQARRSLPSSLPAPLHPRSAPLPTASAGSNASEWNALFVLVVCSLLLLVGALAFLNRNIEASQTGSQNQILSEIHRELQLLQQKNLLLSQQLDVFDVELARLKSASPPNVETSAKNNTIGRALSPEQVTARNTQIDLPIDDSALPLVDSRNFEQLENLPPSAFTERDKVYVVQPDGSLIEGYTGITPALIDSSIRCDVPQAKALLSDGVDVNQLDDRGDSALTWAVKRDCAPMVILLLKSGVDVNSTSQNGFTAYLWARLFRNRHMQTLLEAAGANTKIGSYWYRFEEDGMKAYIERSLEAACRDPLAPGCQG